MLSAISHATEEDLVELIFKVFCDSHQKHFTMWMQQNVAVPNTNSHQNVDQQEDESYCFTITKSFICLQVIDWLLLAPPVETTLFTYTQICKTLDKGLWINWAFQKQPRVLHFAIWILQLLVSPARKPTLMVCRICKSLLYGLCTQVACQVFNWRSVVYLWHWALWRLNAN